MIRLFHKLKVDKLRIKIKVIKMSITLKIIMLRIKIKFKSDLIIIFKIFILRGFGVLGGVLDSHPIYKEILWQILKVF